jgi:nucleoside-triphosphatase THEP1
MAAVPGEFDVFLNHRGPDVKGGFASHLYQALQEAGCRPFLDERSLEKGKPGQEKIYEALGCASVHVAIFSEHYADSSYCLDELCAMLESGKLIIPVFYDVSPNDLHCKLHNGPYTKAFSKTHGRRPESKVKEWKDALCRAAQLFGFRLANYNGDEAKLKTAIVSKVRDHLRLSQLPPVPPYQVGLKEISKELIETLNRMEKDVGILSLVGMGGIGKTTLAKEIYSRLQKTNTFEKKSFLMDVRESEKKKAILDLQKQLAHDLFKEDVKSMEEFNECFDRFRDRKVLIVIDDVDQNSQFDKLIPDINKLGPGSRVIITSRESNVVNNITKNGNCKYFKHEMELLSTIDSRHLFNWHAFHSVDAIDGFQELAKKVADACCGLPLALEITGCFLFDKREECALESTWPQTIKALSERKDILDKLMISYDGLSPEARMMFLDIACFMIGQHEHIAMQIFEACKSDYKGPAPSFHLLKDKCLLKLDEDRRIVMHDLLRDMGRLVVKNESHNMEKGTPSHLWDPEMVQRVLQNKEGTNQVRGLSTFGIGRDGICANNVAENYEGMRRLHFLLLDGVNVKGDFSNWSRELSWLQWINSDLLALPSKLKLQNLAVLNLTSNKELMQIWPNDLEVLIF